ncbi:MAG: TIGR02301 family protein [Devosia sp.]
MHFRPLTLVLVMLCAALPRPALAIDPPYEPQMERLAEVLGSLYFLNPLCKPGGANWRDQLGELVRLDQPDEDRQQRLYGAFNTGYAAYSRLYRSCTPSASEALARLLIEAQATARDIHTRYAE